MPYFLLKVLSHILITKKGRSSCDGVHWHLEVGTGASGVHGALGYMSRPFLKSGRGQWAEKFLLLWTFYLSLTHTHLRMFAGLSLYHKCLNGA